MLGNGGLNWACLVCFWQGFEAHDTNLLCFKLLGEIDLTFVCNLGVLLKPGWLVFFLLFPVSVGLCLEHLLQLLLTKKCEKSSLLCALLLNALGQIQSL